MEASASPQTDVRPPLEDDDEVSGVGGRWDDAVEEEEDEEDAEDAEGVLDPPAAAEAAAADGRSRGATGL